MRAIELFAGCGGAALGIADAGLEHAGCWEIDADAVATLLEVGL
ncbi:MAG: DNA cytosine methyltransferase, partial [Nannocystaceae bacterium]